MRQTSASPSIGGSVTVCYTKWDGSRHWTFPATYLGEDEYGPWVGQARGAVVERPGARFESPWHVVVLFPRDGFTAGFYESPKAVGYVGIGDQISVYIDITTTPTWMHIAEGSAVSMADLDLDVVKQLDGTIFVDDRDEFAEHQVALAYPPDAIEQAEANCARVLGAVQNNDEPYATVGQAWLDGFIATRSRA